MDRRLSVHSARFELITFGLLTAVMLITRTHSLSNLVHLPDTSLASFFLLGYFIRRAIALGGLLLLSFVIDVWVIFVMGGSGFCFTPAYAMLLPAYGVMWSAGRFVAGRYGDELTTLLPAALVVIVAAFISNLFSSGGFYFLGGRYPDPTIAEFLPRLQRYFPGTLLATLLWSGVGAAVYAAILSARPEIRRALTK